MYVMALIWWELSSRERRSYMCNISHTSDLNRGVEAHPQTARQIVRVDDTIRLQIDDTDHTGRTSADSSVLTATPLTTTPVDDSEPTISQSYSTLTGDSSLAINTSVNQLGRSLDRQSTGAIKLAAQKWFRSLVICSILELLIATISALKFTTSFALSYSWKMQQFLLLLA